MATALAEKAAPDGRAAIPRGTAGPSGLTLPSSTWILAAKLCSQYRRCSTPWAFRTSS
jgi:hypothetical protein